MKRSFVIECVETCEDVSFTFYRYRIDGTEIWFSQCNKTGNIYTAVSVDLPTEFNRFELHVRDDYRNLVSYPQFIEVGFHETLRTDEISEYVNKLEYLQDLSEAIMSIFEKNIHKKLYDKYHA